MDNTTVNFGFKFIWVLALLPVYWLWCYSLMKKKEPTTIIKIPSLKASKQNYSTLKSTIYPFLPFLTILAISSLIVGLAGPIKIHKKKMINSSGIDIALVIDVSPSMLSKDFDPNRLEATKQMAINFVNKRVSDRISLSIFSGESYTLSPLTTDHRLIKDALEKLQVGMLADRTAVGMGTASGINALKNSKSKSKVMILLTDGANNVYEIDPISAAQLAADYNIKIYTIGVGTDGEALTPFTQSPSGEYIFEYRKSELNEKQLIEMAQITSGQYFRATTPNALEKIYEQIDKLEKVKMEVKEIVINADYFSIFVYFSICLFIIEIILRNTIFKLPIHNILS